MNGGKRVILHITFDGILFDQVYPKFEEMDGYENRYLLHSFGVDINLRYIKNYEKIIIVDTLEKWGKIIEDPSVDIIYLHGLWISYFRAFDFIRPNVIVMWWCFGMEIYENCLGWPPLLPLKIYKPKTRWFRLRYMIGKKILFDDFSRISPGLYVFFLKTYHFIRGKRIDELKSVLSRIDFAFTPLEMELIELKKRYPYIKAQPFRLRNHFVKESVPEHTSAGGILLEHSANITNNHLDIIAAIKTKKIILRKRDVYIPLNYGTQKLAQRVKSEADFEGANVNCLMDPLSFQEYSNLLSNCTHALFGMIRQSGLGNITLCFRKGIKIFFFKDSILYKHFRSQGFYVFSIEEDLNTDSISEPLSPSQAQHNADLFYSQRTSPGTYKQQFDNFLKENFNNN